MELENLELKEQQSSSLNKVTPLSKYLAMILFVVLPFFGGWVGYQYGLTNLSLEKATDSKVETNTSTSTIKTELDGEVLSEPQLRTSNQKNISFTIPTGWKEIHSTKIALPDGAKEPWFIIKNPSTGCVIASGDFEWDVIGHRQISFSDRIFSPMLQFDGSWIVPVTSNSAPQNSITVTETRKYLDNEVRVSYSSRTNTFYLWQEDGTSVPDSCNVALNEILKTVTYYYEPITLSSSFKGVLWMKHDFNDIEGKDEKSYLLATTPSHETYKVSELPNSINWSGSFYILSNKLYGIMNNQTDEKIPNSKIVVIDPFAATENIVNSITGTATNNSFISALYVLGNKIYYLKSGLELARCLDGYGICRADLYVTDIMGGEQTLLAKNVLGGQIMGYSVSENALYLLRGSGDAGCSSLRVSKYSLGLSGEAMVIDDSWCEGDSESNKATEELKAINSKLTPFQTSTTINVQNGKLTPSDLKPVDAYAQFNFVK